ncbi:MAG TPA: iron-containing alcohol dehydrogenase [Ktedonobacteraceae bacterium]|nr:iron-containing alcohol dehydrogenase [Ktedonobacteraceae bacterium]
MFEQVSAELLERAMQPPVYYGRRILGETLREMQARFGAPDYLILTQLEAWEAAQEQFPAVESSRVVYLASMEYSHLKAMEQELPPAGIVMGIGGGQAIDAAKYVAQKRGIPLALAPTIVSVDAAVTNTIAVREGQRVRYIGFQVADAIPVDFTVIAQAPADLNRAGIGDLLSIHTAIWDWKNAGRGFDGEIAAQAVAILEELDARAEEIRECRDDALRFIMDSYVRENALCLRAGSSQPEEGSEHYLGYNLEYVTRRGYVHGQLICLCAYAMSEVQENRPEWVRSLIERACCPWRLSDLGIAREDFVQALLTLQAYAEAEQFPASVIRQRSISHAFAEELARACDI